MVNSSKIDKLLGKSILEFLDAMEYVVDSMDEFREVETKIVKELQSYFLRLGLNCSFIEVGNYNPPLMDLIFNLNEVDKEPILDALEELYDIPVIIERDYPEYVYSNGPRILATYAKPLTPCFLTANFNYAEIVIYFDEWPTSR